MNNPCEQVGITGQQNETPKEYKLYQNYPNPFNPGTVISFQLPVAGFVILRVYDILGREVATMVNEQLNAGTYSVDWNASNYPSGIYFYTLSTEEFSETRKAALIR